MSEKREKTRGEATRQAVRNAIETILRAGRLPQGAEVLRLVGRGSNTTIYNEVEAWEREAAARLATPEAPAGLWEAFQALWMEANHQATLQFQAQRDGLEQSLRAQTTIAEGAKVDLATARQHFSEMETSLRQLLEAADQREQALREQLIQERTRSAGLDDQLRAAATEIDRMNTAMEQDRIRQDEAMEQAHARYDGLEKRMVMEVDLARLENKEAQRRLKKVDAELTARVQALTEATTRVSLLAQQVHRQERQMEAERHEKVALQERLQATEARADALVAQLMGLVEDLTAAQTKAEEQASKLEKAEARILELETKLADND